MGIPLDQAGPLLDSLVIDTSHIRFDLQHAQPASEIFVAEDDVLVLVVYNSVPGLTVNVSYRHLAPDGTLRLNTWRTTPTSNRAANTTTLPLAEGYLFGLSVYPSGASPKRGQTFISLRVVRGGLAISDPVALLISDYLVSGQLLGHPWSLLRQSIEGPGMLRSITGTDPPANASIAETVPVGARWKLRSLNFSLMTDATVGNREVNLFFVDDLANVVFSTFALFQQAASLQVGYNAAPMGVIGNSAVGFGAPLLPLPIDAFLFSNWRFQVGRTGGAAGDNFSAPIYMVEEWIEP